MHQLKRLRNTAAATMYGPRNDDGIDPDDVMGLGTDLEED